ncbi:hypothetical protein SAMN05660489_00115 [Pseudomonas sp. LAMO17WK12:I10]|uniref:hypothetical protein n=1 Tax=unclassified Pseudomonas TaxID=196821 RepID=UPI000BD42358|nr:MULTISPECIES: hypothetical protein [unclassified Pseudomonas]PXX76635.1 hypothetical protein H160_00406 [Pseudomonas sp. LAMO17WK12:I9]SNY04132.1 hypothetical protein SAMN05660489_00115 [Pseudomonas sp. LAMO17WK12:I10]
MPTIGAISSPYNSQPSTLPSIAPTKPASQRAMTHDSHIFMAEMHFTILDITSEFDKISVKIQDFMVDTHKLSHTSERSETKEADIQRHLEKIADLRELKAKVEEMTDKNPLLNMSSLLKLPHDSEARQINPALETKVTLTKLPAPWGSISDESRLLITEIHDAIQKATPVLDTITEKLQKLRTDLEDNKKTVSQQERHERLEEYNAFLANIKEVTEPVFNISALPEPLETFNECVNNSRYLIP